MSFWSPNIDGGGRRARLGLGVALLAAAGVLWSEAISGLDAPAARGVAVGAALGGGFCLFEAMRGWCLLRACRIRTPL